MTGGGQSSTVRMDPAAVLDARAQAAALLAALFEPGDLVEIRCLPAGPRMWVDAAGHADALAAVGSSCSARGRQNAYFGANPRSCRGGTAKDVALARCLVADFDAPPGGGDGGCTPEMAIMHARERALPDPTAVVSTGRGTHLWWRLDEPVHDLALWDRLQRALAAHLGSDAAIHDPPRIMRLPGWPNRKWPDAPLARLVSCDPARRWSLSEFPAPAPERVAATGASHPRGSLSEFSRRALGSPWHTAAGRRTTLFAVACDMAARGWSVEDATARIVHAAESHHRLGSQEVADLPRQVRNAFAAPRAAIDDTISAHEEARPACYEPADDHAAASRGADRAITLSEAADLWLAHEEPESVPATPCLAALYPDGLPRGQMLCLAAEPGLGKSALALQVVHDALRSDRTLHAVWGMGEMVPRHLVERLAALHSRVAGDGVTLTEARRRTAAAVASVEHMREDIGARMHILQEPLVAEELDEVVAATGAGLAVVDYLQLCRTARPASDRRAEVDQALRALRHTATARNCALLVISNLAKGTGKGSTAADLGKESSEIGYAVDVLVHIVEADDHELEPGLLELQLRCAKNRHGPRTDIRLALDGAHQSLDTIGVELAGTAR